MKSPRLARLQHDQRALALVAAFVAAVFGPSAAAFAQTPAGLPGPPPGNGAGLPAPPGTTPALVPPGTSAAVPGGVTGPGLLSGDTVRFNRAKRTFSVPLACQADGTVRVSARPDGTLASGRYRCSGGRGAANFVLSRKLAAKLVRRRTVAATATVKQGAKTAKLYFTLRADGAPGAVNGFWTDGHLQCVVDGVSQAYLAEPDFTASTAIPISTRGWVAWHTAGGGWHWLGVGGENAGRWETWTATPAGVTQFHPDGAISPVPWTWGPISVPGGQGIHLVGVYEIVYWVGGRPDYQWQYVNAGTTGAAAAGGATSYCVYA
jgi:hypothetical protein